MTTLTIQDTFEPYYAERDGYAKKPVRKVSPKKEPVTPAENRFGSEPNRTSVVSAETPAKTGVARGH